MQSRWSIVTYLVVACLCLGSAVLAQETSIVAPESVAVAPAAVVAAPVGGAPHNGDCGCGNSGGGHSVEGCLKGREISQGDAEALWNGYCEGDCRVGHSKEHGHHGRHCGGAAGCGQSGFGFPSCGQGCGGNCFGGCSQGCGGNGAGGCGNRIAAPWRAHAADCGCDQCGSSRGPRIHHGAGIGGGRGLFGGTGNCGCATSNATSPCCDSGPARPAADNCGTCGSRPRTCHRHGLFRGAGDYGCNDCTDRGCHSWGRGCGDGCRAGAGRIHGFGLGCRCATSNWDDMCAKDSFGPGTPAPVATPPVATPPADAAPATPVPGSSN